MNVGANSWERDLRQLWYLYFEEEFEGDTRKSLAVSFIEFFNSKPEFLCEDNFHEKGFFFLDFRPFLETCMVNDLPRLIHEEFHNTICCIEIAIAVLLIGLQGNRVNRMESTRIRVQMIGVEPYLPLRNLKANFVGKFIAIRGNVVRISTIRPFVKKMNFICGKCGEVVSRKLVDGIYDPPTRCPATSCKSKTFLPDRKSAVTIDWQRIKIQEKEEDSLEAGRVPRTVCVELLGNLVDVCVPGDVVQVAGVVKAASTDLDATGARVRGKDKTLFVLYIEANSITNSKRSGSTSKLSGEFSLRDLYGIREIARQRNVFQLVVNSLCPAIYGHELVKAGLILILFGGNPTDNSEIQRSSMRGDPHILIVGDPGLGKSQMLQAVNNVAPRGVYICGNTTSTTGLTVTLVKEPGTGDYALEAGALVLGDQGVCCVDEFDKMGNEHQAMLEAMEQQCISIAKAGIVCNLSARTSVVAAANPVGGHYDKSKTVNENLKMSAALLSRFDIVFILLDKPDEERDFMLSEHVLALHAPKINETDIQDSQFTPSYTNIGNEEHLPLAQRLKRDFGSGIRDPLPPTLLRKYIQYARKYVRPRLSPDAAETLQEFYLHLRTTYSSSEATPITTRQLESMIRLATARAKLELREVVTRADAQDVIELAKESLYELLSDDMGCIDFRRSTGMSNSRQIKRFVAHLNRSSQQKRTSIFTLEELYEVAEEIGIPTRDFREFIETLNQNNFILKKGNRKYQLQTSSM